MKQIQSYNGISRLTIEIGDETISVLLVEELSLELIGQNLELCFKETNVLVALRIEGVGNSFCSKIVEIQEDELFARIILESHLAKNGNISALVSLDFINQNALKIGSEVFWHISENEITLENIQTIETFKPFGQGFPEPLLGIRINTSFLSPIGKENQHLKVNNQSFSAIGFNMKKPENAETCLLLGNLEKNVFNSHITPQLRIIKIKP